MADLTQPWAIGDVAIPSRIVLAPMAGVSVQAFRRQGRRFGAGLVCSEMVSAAGLSHANERTLGYLRIARDEHPLAVQIFGSEPARMAEAARMVVDAGADIVDINFGCPVRKVTKTGAGASALSDQDLACGLSRAVVEAVDVPVTVKMRRGIDNGSRDALELGPRLEAVGVASLTLHPRSAKQMYTGTADHTLTAELVELVSVPVIASGDIVDRASAERVLDATGAAAVMVGRGAQGQPWTLQEMAEAIGGAARAGRDRRGAHPVHARGRARDGRPRNELPAQVLRLVPPRPPRRQVGEAGAHVGADGCRSRGGAAPVLPGRAGACWPSMRPSSRSFPTPSPTGCSTCRSRSTAGASTRTCAAPRAGAR